MGKLVVFFALMVFLVAVVEGRDLRHEMVRRVKRGFNSGYGRDGAHEQSNEENTSVSREGLTLCSEEDDRGYSGSRELAYGRDAFSNEKRRGNRSFAKSTASATASATASNKNHNLAA